MQEFTFTKLDKNTKKQVHITIEHEDNDITDEELDWCWYSKTGKLVNGTPKID